MTRAAFVLLLCVAATPVDAARLTSVTVLDRDYLVVQISDGDVVHNENPSSETVSRYTPVLNTTAAVSTASWTVTSSQDGNYSGAGRQPASCSRKTKLSGHGQMEWVGSDFRYEYTYQHWIFLRLPSPMQQGMTYTVTASAATNATPAAGSVTFDVYTSRSEAVHVNLAGYAAAADHKAADLYAWLGNGGARDYSSFEGNTVSLYNVSTGVATPVGVVTFWKPSGPDVFWYNLTRSAVWNVDFPGFTTPGTYRLSVEGVGASQDFTIANDVYANPFRVSLRGFYYMRIGQDNPTGISPPPRTPLFIPGSSPANTVVYLTTVTPYDPVWDTIPADQWDKPDEWAPYRKPGNPTNPSAFGGHSDAADWDRHLGHVSIIYDMLLPYILTGGAPSDDGAGIRESGNGIPDLIDEARYEVDFWLRLRDGTGYSHGLTNPNGNNELFQAGPTAMAAWANAANAAMLAEAYRIAGQTALMNTYRDAAIAAYNHASGLGDPQLDDTQDVGYTTVRGRDLKMTAAAYLFNVTGTAAYEDVVNAESVCRTGLAELENDTRNQTWATAAYLLTPRPVRYPALQGNLRACVIDEARDKEAHLSETRPSRRATDDRPGYFRTSQNVQRTMIAHAVATSPADRDLFRKALQLEADWGLGRNPINTIEMGTATTPLAGKRSIEYMYTTGREDGVPGIHPGHTPYLNLDDWFCGMTMGCPSRLYQNTYPTDFRNTWPIGEGYFNSPWVWAHSEFTPQQTMRGKTALYAYLYALGGPAAPPTFALTVGKAGTGSGTVTSSPAGITCGGDCSESYPSGTSVTLTASPAAGSSFAGWTGACAGTGACNVSMTAARSVTATFNTTAPARGTFGNNGNPWAIAASGTTRIQAENFDIGGQAIAYNDSDAANSGGQYRTSEGVDIQTTTDTGGGYNVGWISAGEWLEYTVNVAAAGTYNLKVRVARQPTGTSTVMVLFGGVDKTGSLAVPSTGGWQTWTDLNRTGVSLSAGPQLMRIAMTGGSFNVNWIEVTAAPATTFPLTVTKAGTGTGTVTSVPAGISCGSDCSESYASGTTVTLTAAAVAGSTFAGWSGACSGTGSCAVTMSAARSVTASFNATTPVATIYGDALASDWASWSWSATIDFNGTSPVRVGTRAINVTYQGWGGLSLRKGTAQSTSGYTALKFWVHGGTGTAKSLRVYTQTADGGGESPSVVVSAPANTWTEITVPLSSLGNPASIKRLNIQENSGTAPPMMTFDEIRLTP
jgi:endoglucanase